MSTLRRTGLLRRRALGVGVGCCLAALSVAVAYAQTPPPYPERAVTLVVPYAAGTPTDQLARVVSARLAEVLRQPVTVENKPATDPLAAALDVRKAPADGYTLLFATSATLGIGPALDTPARLDPVKDFTPVSLVATMDYLLVAPPSFGVRDAKAALDAMKARPGKVRFASPGKTDPSTLLLRGFAAKAGVQLQEVAFSGDTAAVAGLASGKADVMFLDAGTALPLVQQGKLVALGTSAARPQPQLPDVPPLARTVGGFDWRVWQGIVARTGTPKGVVSRIAVEMREIEATASFREAVGKLAMESIPAQKPEHFGAVIAVEQPAWADLVKAAATP